MFVEKTLTVNLWNGIHARPSAAICKTVMAHNLQRAEIIYLGQTANCFSVFDLMKIGVVYGAGLQVRLEGDTAAAAMAALEHLLAQEYIDGNEAVTPRKNPPRDNPVQIKMMEDDIWNKGVELQRDPVELKPRNELNLDWIGNYADKIPAVSGNLPCVHSGGSLFDWWMKTVLLLGIKDTGASGR